MQDIIQFLLSHWLLASAFLIVLALLLFEEARSKGMGGAALTPQMAIRLINRDEAVVVDCRDGHAFKEGHIITSMNFPQAELNQNLNKLAKYKEKTLIIVCSTGQKSAAIATKLRKEGFVESKVLTGGLAAWKKADLPLEKGK